MSPNKGTKVIKYCVISSTTAIVLILSPCYLFQKRHFYWNQCFKKTSQWIDKYEMKLKIGIKHQKKVLQLQFAMELFMNTNLRQSNSIDSQSKFSFF